jgi:hypothetical protein
MNMVLKSAISAAILVASTGAYASYTPVESGASDLVLWVQATGGSGGDGTYAFDTGLNVSTVFGSTFTASANLVALPGLSQTFSSIGAGATTLSSFLSTAEADGDSISWALQGGFFTGTSAINGNTKTQGAAEAIFTSTLASASTPNGVSVLTNGSIEQLLNGYANTGTAPVGAGAQDSAISLTATSTGHVTTAATWTTGDQAKFGILGNGSASDAIVGVGGPAVTLYGITGNNPTSGVTGAVLQSYTLGTASLSAAGVLTLLAGGGSPPVPLPPALWLLGSGLLGLFGVSRRLGTSRGVTSSGAVPA